MREPHTGSGGVSPSIMPPVCGTIRLCGSGSHPMVGPRLVLRPQCPIVAQGRAVGGPGGGEGTESMASNCMRPQINIPLQKGGGGLEGGWWNLFQAA